ncbi:MAG TPA: hypothetical protein VEJ47_05675 [Candidatus Eremiobacteraceae bacterium]|nr:hypothetical protein [Candidatus Eremiobacteraceae bacterium]
MKATRKVAGLWVLLLVVAAGCKQQSRRIEPNSNSGTAGAAAPAATSPGTISPVAGNSTTATVQQAGPVFVFAKPPSAPSEASAPANPGKVHEVVPRLDLAQSGEQVVLQGSARTMLETALASATGKGPVELDDETATALMQSLPEEFRDSCDEMAATWAENWKAKWSVRVLYSLRTSAGTQAVLALRCTPSMHGRGYYDERPATVSVNRQSATVDLVPLGEECSNCSDLYRVEFSQAFPAPGAQLVELQEYHSSDNPCCGGGDEDSGNRRVILDLATGKQALSIDERSEWESHDDSTEDADTEGICDTKISYLRNGAGNVESIVTETRCTENGKPEGEVKKQTFRWNGEARKYEEVK